MLKIDSLALSSTLLWKKVTFPIRDGVTVVHGANRSGKSLLVSGLPAALGYSSLPEGASATVTGKGISIVAQAKKSMRYSITHNGKELKTSTLTASRNWLSKHLPNVDLYEAAYHVKGTSPNPLTTTKAAGAYAYLSNVLGLHQIWKEAYKETVRRLSDLRQVQGEHDGVLKSLDSLHLPKLPEPVNLDIFAKMQAKLNRLQQTHTEQMRVAEQLKWQRFSHLDKEQKQALAKSLRDLLKCSNEQDSIAEQKSTDYAHKLAAYSEGSKTQQRRKELLALNPLDPSVLPSINHLLLSKLGQYKEDFLKFEKNVPPPPKVPLAQLHELHVKKMAEISSLKAAIQSLENGHGNTCPTCMHPLKGSIKTYLGTYRDLLSKAQDKLSRIKEEIKIGEVRQRWDVIPRNYREIMTALTGYRKRVEIGRELSLLKKPSVVNKPVKPPEYASSTAWLEKLRDALAKEMDVEITVTPMSKARIVQLSEEIEALREQVTKMQTDITSYNTIRQLRKEHKASRSNLQAKLVDYKHNLRNVPALHLLKDAFGKNGVQSQMLEEISTSLSQQLNRNATLIWSDPYEFSVTIQDGRAHILVTRNGRQGTLHTLSGSEQRCWQMLWCLTLLQLTPMSKRLPFVILDEIEANADKHTRRRIIENFLPELRKVVDKIIVVTPLDRQEFPVQADHYYTVVNNGKTSELRLT